MHIAGILEKWDPGPIRGTREPRHFTWDPGPYMWEPEPNTHLYVERGTGYIKNPYIKGTLMQI